jgi:maltooligosyltrehalose synthase
MGVLKADNGWWLDVLEHGQASRHAGTFDIDWEPESEELRGKVLVPILGDQYGTVLERGERGLRFEIDMRLVEHHHGISRELPHRAGALGALRVGDRR